MRKQYGVTFEAPRCKGHGEEMSLSVMRPNDTTYVEWYCPHDDVRLSCDDVRDVTRNELPEALQYLIEDRLAMYQAWPVRFTGKRTRTKENQGEMNMNMKDELKELGYKPGEVTVNTFIYTDKDGKLSGMECPPDALPLDYGGDGYYPSRAWDVESVRSLADRIQQEIVQRHKHAASPHDGGAI